MLFPISISLQKIQFNDNGSHHNDGIVIQILQMSLQVFKSLINSNVTLLAPNEVDVKAIEEIGSKLALLMLSSTNTSDKAIINELYHQHFVTLMSFSKDNLVGFYLISSSISMISDCILSLLREIIHLRRNNVSETDVWPNKCNKLIHCQNFLLIHLKEIIQFMERQSADALVDKDMLSTCAAIILAKNALKPSPFSQFIHELTSEYSELSSSFYMPKEKLVGIVMLAVEIRDLLLRLLSGVASSDS